MRSRLVACVALGLGILLLVTYLGILSLPALADTPDAHPSIHPSAPAPLTGDQQAVAADSASGPVTPTTYYTDITPGAAQVMGDTGVILRFAPGADGVVMVTLVPTTPFSPPPGGALPLRWLITTTAPSYEVTATFVYSRAAGDSDIVLVVDRSGSMEFATLCYGCWDDAAGIPYPGGNIYPLPWNGPADGPPAHCTATHPYSVAAERYFFIEAEEYTHVEQHPYDRDLYELYATYWILQRNGRGATARSGDGAYIMHMPFQDQSGGSAGYYGVSCRRTDIQHDGSCNTTAPLVHQAPRADYDFVIPNDVSYNDTYYIWVRGQAADGWGGTSCIHWGIDEVYQDEECDFERGTGYNGASSGDWEWRRLDGSFTWSQGTTHTLNIWAGGAGFALDRIAITTNAYIGAGEDAPGVIDSWNGDRGAYEWADGRTGAACDPCDARFGGYPGGTPNCTSGPNPDRRTDDIYDDEQYMRAVIEAFKGLAREPDPARDQIGLVRYSSSIETVSELQCLVQHPISCTQQVISDTIIAGLDETYASGSTNIAGAIQGATQVLSTENGHYARPEAAPIIVLLTDGRPTYRPLGPCDDDPDIWPGDANADCTVYYALRARDLGIIIHVITLGYAADSALMQHVADITGGQYRNAEWMNDLGDAFAQLLEQDFLHSPVFRPQAIYHRDSPTGSWTLHPPSLTHADASSWSITGTHITELSEWTLGYLPPHRVVLDVSPSTLPADGVSTANLAVTVTNALSEPVQDGTVVTFATSLGSVSPVSGTTSGGLVTGMLTAGLQPGWATVTATVGEVSGTTQVEFLPLPPHQVTLLAVPQVLPADGVSTAILTATVTDVYSQPVQNGAVVTLSTSLGSVSPLSGTTTAGVLTGVLTASHQPGLAIITATAGGITGTTQVQILDIWYLPVVIRASFW